MTGLSPERVVWASPVATPGPPSSRQPRSCYLLQGRKAPSRHASTSARYRSLWIPGFFRREWESSGRKFPAFLFHWKHKRSSGRSERPGHHIHRTESSERGWIDCQRFEKGGYPLLRWKDRNRARCISHQVTSLREIFAKSISTEPHLRRL